MEKILYKCESVVDCTMVASLLQSEGIWCIIKRNEVTMFSGIKELLEDNSWGFVIVKDEDFEDAQKKVYDYFKSLKEDKNE